MTSTPSPTGPSTDQDQAPHEAAQVHEGAPGIEEVERPTAEADSRPEGEGLSLIHI